jgi:hypothetical protein
VPIHGEPKAVTVRVVHGDIADAQASMIVVNHLNGLPPTGATASVDATQLIGVRDVATVLHGAGGLHVPPQVAAKRMVTGVLEGLARNGSDLRELSIVELDGAKLPAIRSGVRQAAGQVGIHVYLHDEELVPRRRAAEVHPVDGAIPPHLRLGITRNGGRLSIFVSGL